MTDSRDLYQEIILEHNRRPRNFGELAGANRQAEGYNPLCGDKVHVFARLEGDKLAGLSFEGAGCAISQASASLMTEAVEGKSLDEVRAIFDRFLRLLTGGALEGSGELGNLEVFVGVSRYPMRVKCATLAWHTLRAALESAPMNTPVTTE